MMAQLPCLSIAHAAVGLGALGCATRHARLDGGGNARNLRSPMRHRHLSQTSEGGRGRETATQTLTEKLFLDVPWECSFLTQGLLNIVTSLEILGI